MKLYSVSGLFFVRTYSTYVVIFENLLQEKKLNNNIKGLHIELYAYVFSTVRTCVRTVCIRIVDHFFES